MTSHPSGRPSSRATKLLRAVYQWPAFYLTLLLLGAAQLLWALIAFGIWHLVSEETGRVIGRRFISRLYRHCFGLAGWFGLLRLDATSLDAIDADEGMIIASNHPSVMDALILISRHEKLGCIMKASVLDNVFLGAGARLAGYIRNDGPKRLLRLSAADLKRGGQLIVFPEGTRTLAAPVNPFKGGFAAMARLANVPIQTVIIETDTPYLSKGWPILKMPPRFPMNFRVRLGRRFELDGRVDPFVVDLHAYFSAELAGAQLGDLWQRRPTEPQREDCVDGSHGDDDRPPSSHPLTESLTMTPARVAAHAPLRAATRNLQR